MTLLRDVPFSAIYWLRSRSTYSIGHKGVQTLDMMRTQRPQSHDRPKAQVCLRVCEREASRTGDRLQYWLENSFTFIRVRRQCRRATLLMTQLENSVTLSKNTYTCQHFSNGISTAKTLTAHGARLHRYQYRCQPKPAQRL